MKMSKVGNQTNSQDPQAVNSRVFVGNLNTFQCSKTDVERMFQRYGRLAGISMHKGYAFVQFTNPFDARSACLGEDGRTILSQILDVNMVAEPKPHQTGRKRQNLTKTGNDWDYYYDSYYASTASYPVGPGSRLVPPLKRPRLMVTSGSGGRPAKIQQKNSTNNNNNNANNNNNGSNGVTGASGNCGGIIASQQAGTLNTNNNNNGAIGTIGALTTGNVNNNNGIQTSATTTSSINLQSALQQNLFQTLDSLKIYSNPDILICGNCREMFNELHELLEHKKSYCKLRFTCKCHTPNTSTKRRTSDESLPMNSSIDPVSSSTVSLLCVQCKDSFPNAWDLMVHVQAAHMLNIYELGTSKDKLQLSSTASTNEEDTSSEPPLSPASDAATHQIKNCESIKGNVLSGNDTSDTMEEELLGSQDADDNQFQDTNFIPIETSVHINEFLQNGRSTPVFSESSSISIEGNAINQMIVNGP